MISSVRLVLKPEVTFSFVFYNLYSILHFITFFDKFIHKKPCIFYDKIIFGLKLKYIFTEVTMKIPEIKAMARKLIYLCLGTVLVYTFLVAKFSSPLSPLRAVEVLHSMLLSTIMSLGGGLLLDLEIRHGENKR